MCLTVVVTVVVVGCSLLRVVGCVFHCCSCGLVEAALLLLLLLLLLLPIEGSCNNSSSKLHRDSIVNDKH